MAHGKETPRQKMIGMMYLVLMALLALNVSKEVLEAFVIVDHGIVQTTENFTHKNDVYYDQFDQAAAENPVKAGPWKAKADEVRRQSNELYNYIQELKIEIVTATEGEGSEAIGEDNHIDGHEIQAKDNNTVPAEIMIGPDKGGKANDLRSAIEGYRGYLLSLVGEGAEEVRQSIEENLDTEDPPYDEKEGQLTWQEEHFEHYPMIAVITLMSKMQSDVRNAESDALRYLYSQIDAGAFKFNWLESVVLAESNYIIRGNDYRAEVFMAAFDTTQQPTVYIGEYDSTVNDDGTVVYNMKGAPGVNYDTLPVKGGRGIYELRPTSTGFRSWGGLISLKRMDGTTTNKPFHAEYRVAEPALIVSPTKMNVFYQGLDNPIDVSAPGTPREQLSVTVNNGSISGSGGTYIVVPTRLGTCDVNVTARVEGATKSLGSVEFRVKETPDPYPTLAGKRLGSVRKSDILAEIGIKAEMPEWFEFDIEHTITKYTFSVTVGQFSRNVPATSGDFPSDVRELIRNAASGTRIYFNDIYAVGLAGRERFIGSLSVQLQ